VKTRVGLEEPQVGTPHLYMKKISMSKIDFRPFGPEKKIESGK